MAGAPLFSVIIPTYGRPEFLTEAVSSVLRQSVGSVECIVVDDCSSQPPTLPRDPRIRLVRRRENGGPGAARNTGLAEATGTFVAFLDDDDLFEPDRLAIAREGLRHFPITICWSRYLDQQGGRGRLLTGDVSGSVLDDMTPHVGATALRRDVMLPFDERFDAAEDVEWWLRVARSAPVSTVPRIGHLVRRHPGVRRKHGLEARIRGSLLLLDLHADYFGSHPAAAGFRWKRIGLTARQLGNYALARRAFLASLRRSPQAATAWHLLRSLRAGRGDAEWVSSGGRSDTRFGS